MAEWSNAAVLKTVEGHTSGGSNPSFSAENLLNSTKSPQTLCLRAFLILFVIKYQYKTTNKKGLIRSHFKSSSTDPELNTIS